MSRSEKFHPKKANYEETVYELITLPVGPWYQEEGSDRILPAIDNPSERSLYTLMMSSLAVSDRELPMTYEGKEYRYVYSVFWEVHERSICLNAFAGREEDVTVEDIEEKYGRQVALDMCDWDRIDSTTPMGKFFCHETKEFLDMGEFGAVKEFSNGPSKGEEGAYNTTWEELEELLYSAAETAGLTVDIHLGGSFDLLYNDVRLDFPSLGAVPDDYEDELWGLADYIFGTQAQDYDSIEPDLTGRMICFAKAIVDGLPQYIPA